MHEHFQFTVEDVLKRKHFEKAKVIAGHQGVHRIVKWVHVVEVTNIHHLLRGKELILSTGVGWKENGALLLSFLRQLIECDASGLCIEIGTYTSSIPQEVIQLADDHQFPLILFLQEVPFVEITQDIHTYLINRHYQMIANLEAYSQQLNKKLLSIDHYHGILKFLHHYLGHQVLFQMNGEAEFVPECSEKKKREWLTYVEQPSKQSASQTIQLFHNDYAQLSILSAAQEISEFDLLILDRTATAIAQHLLRDLYVEEKKRMAEQEWLKGWVEGEHSPQAISAYLAEHVPQVKPKGGCVVLCKFPSAKLSKDVTYFLLLFRTIFEQQGFHLFSVQLRHSLLFIFVNKRDINTWKVRMHAGIERLLQSEFMPAKKPSVALSVGKFVDNLVSLPKSYQTAQETSRIQQRLGKKIASYFYEDLHMARVVSLMESSGNLRDMVKEYLEPVIQYDKKHNGKLLETLKVYLACNGSKKETAERLFIVRQTLYHRLQKLEQLLGNDFMHPEKRLAMECMIYAYEYLPDLLE